jgi:decaprenylphospho-beta-D-ribofuranose 2-oxidase
MNTIEREVAKKRLLPLSRLRSVSGYGFTTSADGFVYRPTSVADIREIFDDARSSGRKVVLRGSGRSYGDANVAPEAIVVDITRMRRILNWDRTSGIIECEAGATIEDLWRYTLEDGYWPPVVSGTMYPTLAGALAMNIHGKNNFKVGTIGEHVLEIDVLKTDGELVTLSKDDRRFYAVVSGAGLLGVITRVKLRMKKIDTGNVQVLAYACKNWDEQFAVMERFQHDSDYLVSWIDCFAPGDACGRGQIHAAWYEHDEVEFSSSLAIDHQDLPDTILGLVPKSMVWRFLKPLNNRFGMRFINSAKQFASSKLGDKKIVSQSLVAFSFLLDYVPNWRNAYLPGGFIQYQSFVPKEHAKRVFSAQVKLQQAAKLESFLGVLKRHKPDPFLFSHAVDGYSLALDFKVTKRNWRRLQELCHQMNDLVLEAGGRFYLAKDSTLRPSDLSAYLGEETLAQFRLYRKEFDPGQLLTSALAVRLGLA